MPMNSGIHGAPGQLRIESGHDEYLVAADGRKYIDFVTGYGSILLGHGRRRIVERVQQQLEQIWTSARSETPIVQEAAELVDSRIGEPYGLVQFCSSGNEAVEFAIRIAAVETQRKSFVGFSRNMHGKSVAASAMCWTNRFVDVRDVETLPFIDSCKEVEIIERLEQLLSAKKVAAVFTELIQGTNGAHEASQTFYATVCDLCRTHGSFFIVDEILTGFYRAGSLSYSRELGLSPDILVFGKAMGNGFPVSAVLCRNGIEISNRMLPGSTYASNPIAAAAITATIAEMSRVDVASKSMSVHAIIHALLSDLDEAGISLRGRGSLWALELPDSEHAQRVTRQALAANVLVSAQDRFVRLFPPVTISTDNLRHSLEIIRGASLSSIDG